MNYVAVVSAHEHGVRSNARRIRSCFCWCLVCSYIEYTEWAASACLQHGYGCDTCCSAFSKTESGLLAFYLHPWFPAWFYTFTTSCVHTVFLLPRSAALREMWKKGVRNKYLSFTLYVMLLDISNSMRRVIEKLVVPLLLKELLVFYGTRRLVIVITEAPHLSISWTR